MLEPMDTYRRVENQILEFVQRGDLDHAINQCENELKALPETGYHSVLGRDWLAEVPRAAKWLAEFYEKASKKFPVKSLYCEMNRFEINPNEWYVDAFAFDMVDGLDDLDWLCDWKDSTDFESRFVLPGMQDLQRLFATDFSKSLTADILAPSELAIHLLTLRMQQLINAATHYAREKKMLPETVPVLATAHESDMVFSSGGA